MANGQGDTDRGPARPAWSGSSTPPDVYGNFSRPGLTDDLMERLESETTAEDMAPPPDIRKAHQVREKMHHHLTELEESGEYDIRALAPLRHLLDQDWTDPNVRSRLQARVAAEDARLAQQAPGGPLPPAKPWFDDQGNSNDETVQVSPPPAAIPPTVVPSMPVLGLPQSGAAPAAPATSAGRPPAQAPAQPAGPPATPAQARPSAPAAPGAPQAPAQPAGRPAARPAPAAQARPATPAAPAAPTAAPAPARPAAPAAAAPPASTPAARSPVPAYPPPPPKPAHLADYPPAPGGVGATAAKAAPPPLPPKPPLAPQATGQAEDGLKFDDEDVFAPEPVLSTRSEPPAPPLSSQPVPIRRKVQPWLLVAGAGLVVAALLVPESVFAGPPTPAERPTFVLHSEPKAQVTRGEEVLGETPLLLRENEVGGGLMLRAEGFENQVFSLSAPLSENKVEKRQVILLPTQVTLDWSGLPEGSQLLWQGEAVSPDSLKSAAAGQYSLSVTVPERPPVTLSVTVPEPSAQQTSIAVGQQVAGALAKQPNLSVSFKAGKKMPKLPLAVTIDGGPSGQGKSQAFHKTANLDGKTAFQLVLPGPGTYQVKVPASATHKAFNKQLTLQEGASQNLEIALEPIPPKVAQAPPPSSGGGGGAAPYYAPEPVYYSPPPAYYSGGGGGGSSSGGGGGSIAPPSF